MNQDIRSYLKRYIDIEDSAVDQFLNRLTRKSFNKKQFLLKEGDLCSSRYFIVKGCIRMFYVDQNGNEQIVHFAIENWWISDYESLIHERPSKFNIQALEPTEVLLLRESDLDMLAKEIPQIERLFRKIMEKTYIAMQRRFEYDRDLSGRDFYEHFINENPVFAQRVPQYMLASYLGLTPEFVSKLRTKKK